MADKVDSGDESNDDYGDQGGSVSWYGDYHYGGQPVDYHNWPTYSGYSQPYCDNVSHTILPPKESSGCTGIIMFLRKCIDL